MLARLITGGVAVLLLLVACSTVAWALPRNTRQVPQGYWVGGSPDAGDIDQLYERGVRLVVSAARMTQPALRRLESLGMERLNVRFGSTFRHGDRILAGTEGYRPDEMFIHCAHGGDRAGAMLAFMLVIHHDFAIDHALLAVANPGVRDLRNLTRMMEDRGLCVREAEHTEWDGIYSGARNGGSGGLKVRGASYRNLVTTLLNDLEERDLIVESATDCEVEESDTTDDGDDDAGVDFGPGVNTPHGQKSGRAR